MNKVIHLASKHAGTVVQTPAQRNCTSPSPLERQQAIENALSMALHFVRQPGESAANVWAATARTNRALTLLKQASQGNAAGNTANAMGRA